MNRFFFFSFERISYQVKGDLWESFCFQLQNAQLIRNNKIKIKRPNSAVNDGWSPPPDCSSPMVRMPHHPDRDSRRSPPCFGFLQTKGRHWIRRLQLKYLDTCCLTGKRKADFLSNETVLQLRNPAQTLQRAALPSTSAVSVHVCRTSWKPDRFTEVREDHTINFRNGKLKQSMSPQCMLTSDKGSHWDTPTEGRRFNYCNLYFKCNDLRYPS